MSSAPAVEHLQPQAVAASNLAEILGGGIEKAEAVLLRAEQAPCPVVHRFGPGTYIREVFIPAGTFAIGHYQKFEHTNVFLKGRVTMYNEDGTPAGELVAPMIFVGKPGRKIGLVTEDMVWLNIYATPETDVEKLEAMLLDKSDPYAVVPLQLDHEAITADRQDFEQMLADLGVTAQQVRQQSENESDQIPFPYGSYKVCVADSGIEGKGLFATSWIEPGEFIAPARFENKRTPAGRFTNHSKTPNAEMKWAGETIMLVATQQIKGATGGRLGEEVTVDYRQARRTALAGRMALE